VTHPIDAQGLSGPDAYRLLISLIAPRPIAWVGTRSAAGQDNLAPFSFFMGVTGRPPTLALSVARGRQGGLKDTARNILETGVFTVSTVPYSMREAMNQSSAPYPPEVSELEAAGLGVIEGVRVNAPRPAGAPTVMECRLVHSHDLGSAHLLVGEVLVFHIEERVLRVGEGGPTVDTLGLDLISRLGGPDYTRVTEAFTLPSPQVTPPKTGG
jgi:flavin reductase (DIM6/NTAB) family NADH-FMN oxidoreductase RutF